MDKPLPNRASGDACEKADSVPLCFCFNVSEREVEEHFFSPTGTYETLVDKTKIGTKCTACLLDLDLLLDRIHQARPTLIQSPAQRQRGIRGFRHALDFVDSGFFLNDIQTKTIVRLANFSQLFGKGARCVPFKFELILFSELGKLVGHKYGRVDMETSSTVEIVPNDESVRGWFLLALTPCQKGFFGTMRPQVLIHGSNWCATYHTQPHMMASVGKTRHEVILQGDGRSLSSAVVVINGSRAIATGVLVLRDPRSETRTEAPFSLAGNGCGTFYLHNIFPEASVDRPLFISVRCDKPVRNHIINLHADNSYSIDHFPN